MDEFIRIGVDPAKNCFHVHALARRRARAAGDGARGPADAAAKGIGRVDALVGQARADAGLPAVARACVEAFAARLAGLDAQIGEIERQIACVLAQDETSRLLDAIPGVGPLIATAIAASAPDPRVFKSARNVSAWLGLTPRQNATGGETTLGPITRKGDRYLRKLLVVGATSLLPVAGKREGALADWIVALRARRSARHVSIALANKLARIVWAAMSSGEAFRKEIFARA